MTVRKGSLAPIKTALLPAPFLVRTIREETGPIRPAIAGATVSTGVSDPREQPALALLMGKPARVEINVVRKRAFRWNELLANPSD